MGERVALGQQVGLVGNSGNTSEPHFHVHLQEPEIVLERAPSSKSLELWQELPAAIERIVDHVAS